MVQFQLNPLPKAKKRVGAKGMNPLKKIEAAIQTKSLGNKREHKKAIDQAIADVSALTIAIVDYVEKKMAKAG